MKKVAFGIAILIAATTAAFADEADRWGNAVFESAAEAYGFAADHADGVGPIVARVVVRTDERYPHFIVFFTSQRPTPPRSTPVAFSVIQDSGNALWVYFGTVGVAEPKGVVSYGNKWIVWWVARKWRP